MSTRYKKSPYTARVMLNPQSSLRAATIKQVLQAVQREIHNVCLRKHRDSLLRQTNYFAMKRFSWKRIIHELNSHAPILVSFVKSALAKCGRKVPRYAVGVCASVLLKNRNRNLALIQAMISVVMYAGHCSKQVCELPIYSLKNDMYMHVLQVFLRLNRLGLCLSHSKTIGLIKDLGTDYDATVRRWKHAQELVMEGKTSETRESEESMSSDEDTMSSSEEALLEFTTGTMGYEILNYSAFI